MANLAGSTPAALAGQSESALFDGEVPASWRHAEQAAVARGGATAAEAKVNAGGATRELRVIRWPFAAEGAGAPTHLACLWVDLTRERQREAQLKQALVQLEQLQRTNDLLRREAIDTALRDRVTGLYTRGHFEDQLRREVDLSTREHREFALVMIALDPPTEAVRARGEAAQTRVLEALGRLLRSNTRAMDASCRMVEDRFAVLLSGVGLATAHSRMEGLRRQCATQIVVLDGEELGFSVSMGVASYPHTAGSQDELISACESALAHAQGRGGNNVCLASIRLAVD
jgi:diguanylate cyclase (GGDEF)-like protein